jgi:hypothetical protein
MLVGSVDRADALNGDFEVKIVGWNFSFEPNAIADPIGIIADQVGHELIWRDFGVPRGFNVVRIGSFFGQTQHNTCLMRSLREGEIVKDAADDREKIDLVVGHVGGSLNGQFHFISLRPSKRFGPSVVSRKDCILGLQAVCCTNSVFFDGFAICPLSSRQIECECQPRVDNGFDCWGFSYIFEIKQKRYAAANFGAVILEGERTDSLDRYDFNPGPLSSHQGCVQSPISLLERQPLQNKNYDRASSGEDQQACKRCDWVADGAFLFLFGFALSLFGITRFYYLCNESSNEQPYQARDEGRRALIASASIVAGWFICVYGGILWLSNAAGSGELRS